LRSPLIKYDGNAIAFGGLGITRGASRNVIFFVGASSLGALILGVIVPVHISPEALEHMLAIAEHG
jgi:hypothetical protein